MKEVRKRVVAALLMLAVFVPVSTMCIFTARAEGETAVHKEFLYPQNGQTDYPYSRNALELPNGYYIRAYTGRTISIHTMNGYAAYCIDPRADSGGTYMSVDGEEMLEELEKVLEQAEYVDDTLDAEQMQGVLGRLFQVAFSDQVKTAPNAGAAAARKYIATQLLVWETIAGMRDVNFNLVQGTSTLAALRTNNPDYSAIKSYYNEYVSAMQGYETLPSFMTGPEEYTSCELEHNEDRDVYEISFTDDNGVLDKFNFTVPEGSNISISANGNELTVSSPDPLGGEIEISAEKKLVNTQASVIWSSSKSGAQKMTSGGSLALPVRAHLYVYTQAQMAISVDKSDTISGRTAWNGTTLSGAELPSKPDSLEGWSAFAAELGEASYCNEHFVIALLQTVTGSFYEHKRLCELAGLLEDGSCSRRDIVDIVLEGSDLNEEEKEVLRAAELLSDGEFCPCCGENEENIFKYRIITADGEVVADGLRISSRTVVPSGSYLIEEVQSPAGYEISGDALLISEEELEEGYFTFKNELKGCIKIRKTNEDGSSPEGTEFALYGSIFENEDEYELIGIQKADEEGELIWNELDTYTGTRKFKLAEVKTSGGTLLTDEIELGTLPGKAPKGTFEEGRYYEDDEWAYCMDITWQITDGQKLSMPMTGSQGIKIELAGAVVAAMALAGIAAVLWGAAKQKMKE